MTSTAHDPFRGSPAGTSDDDTVPAGTVADVLEWVGGDYDRAARALHAEQQRSKPRHGVVDNLEELLTGAESDAAEPDSLP